MEYIITGFSNSAATSRMIWMLSASSCCKCVNLSRSMLVLGSLLMRLLKALGGSVRGRIGSRIK